MRKQKHRGKHSKDKKLFSVDNHDKLKSAVEDLAMLLAKGYNDKSSLKLVGDRYKLVKRQRRTVLMICGDPKLIREYKQKEVATKAASGNRILIDGFNLLIFAEALLSNAFIFKSLDGIHRDIASVHGSYKRVQETIPALEFIGEEINKLHITEAQWYLDAPVSNSRRLKHVMNELADEKGYPWQIDVVKNPDQELIKYRDEIVVSSDRLVLEHAPQWINLNSYLVDACEVNDSIVDLGLQLADSK